MFRFVAITAFIVLCTLLPFLPGRYDSMAVPLSSMARFFGGAGLLLVPVGALWIGSRYSSWLFARQHVLSIAALIAASAVWLFVSLGAMIFGGLALGLGALALGVYVLFRIIPAMRPLRRSTPRAVRPAGLYLLCMPIAVVLLQLWLIGPAVEFSRSRAIRSAAQLIADVEQYRVAHGRYPPSLLAVWKDYSPSVIGIDKFHYEPSGEAYNVAFEQPASDLATREIVVYNPRDEQVMWSHASARLQPTAQELTLEQSRGHYAVYDAPHPHWKYFWFD